MSTVFDRVPPFSLEAEQSVLGAMFLEREAVLVAAEILQPEDFYRDAHRYIFEAILELEEKGRPADLVTVTETLRQQGRLEDVGGLAYVTTLAQSVPTAANVEYYARIVEEKSILRRLIREATRIVQNSYEATDEAAAILDEAEQAILRISQYRNHSGFFPVKDLISAAYDRIEYLYQNKGGVTGIPTGFKDLDRLTAGLQPSDLIIVAARPAMGKTSFALNIALHVALEAKIPVAIFSLEMSREQLIMRMLSSEAGIDGQRLRTGFLDEEDWLLLTTAMARLSEAPIYIDDTPNITVMDIRAKARRLVQEQGQALILLDYLQLVNSRRSFESRQQEITEISRGLKALARELQVPVVALSQLSRAVEQRQDKRPVLSDLRESGAIEQDADVVAFIYRDEYYNPDTETKKGIAEIIIGKQRNGPTGVVQLAFLKDSMRFRDLSYIPEEP
ncbi:MAG: replicative DNA helicase [bacterium]|jgi:replicative DNA helicase|nr:replicative DNA helicase [Bacillota bacterium]